MQSSESSDGSNLGATLTLVGAFMIIVGLLAFLGKHLLRTVPGQAHGAPAVSHRGKKPRGSQRLPDDEDDGSRKTKGKASRSLPNAPSQDEILGDDRLDGIDEESGSDHGSDADTKAGSAVDLHALRAENEQLRAELKKLQTGSNMRAANLD